MSEPHDTGAEEREAGQKSERLLDDTYLSGAVGMGASGPRLSAGTLGGGEDEPGEILAHRDDSWRSHAEEEGEPGDYVAAPSGGLRGFVRRLFGG